MIETIDPNNEAYETLEEFLEADKPRFDYENLANKYNEAPVNFILVFEYHGSTMSNLVKMMNIRGLTRGENYEFRATQVKSGKGTFKVVLKKLTEKKFLTKEEV